VGWGFPDDVQEEEGMYWYDLSNNISHAIKCLMLQQSLTFQMFILENIKIIEEMIEPLYQAMIDPASHITILIMEDCYFQDRESVDLFKQNSSPISTLRLVRESHFGYDEYYDEVDVERVLIEILVMIREKVNQHRNNETTGGDKHHDNNTNKSSHHCAKQPSYLKFLDMQGYHNMF
jgi:hypothetical protein